VNVVRYLAENVKIPSSRIYAAGYGANFPIADNDTEKGRALNRRIEIILAPELERSTASE
jgi:chemotaxis protein MotB